MICFVAIAIIILASVIVIVVIANKIVIVIALIVSLFANPRATVYSRLASANHRSLN